MKVLISAYACEAGRGSEPGVGWNVVWEVAKHHEVWVLTRPDDGKEANEAFLAENPNSNLKFVYFTLPVLGGFWKLGSIAFVLHYYLWQIQAYFVARKLHRQIGFDVAHHVTFVRYSSPSFISLLPVPFVWGPVGGGETAPKPFYRDFSRSAKRYEFLRWFAHQVGERDPFARMTARRSAIAYATTQDTAQRVRKMGASEVKVMSACSLSSNEIEQLGHYELPAQAPVRFISIGRLLHWKGFHLGIRAFAEAELEGAEYWILGEGGERTALEDLAQRLGVGDRIRFLGNLPRHETLLRLAEANVLVHPSLHDSGGWVCLEAMAARRPVLCLDLGGPSVQIGDRAGIKVSAYEPKQSVKELAEAMQKLAVDQTLQHRLGEAGRLRIQRQFSCEAKGQQIAQLYEQIVNRPKTLAGDAATDTVVRL